MMKEGRIQLRRIMGVLLLPLILSIRPILLRHRRRLSVCLPFLSESRSVRLSGGDDEATFCQKITWAHHPSIHPGWFPEGRAKV